LGRVILIVSDALRDDTAAQQMGYLPHLVEEEKATRYTVIAEMPTMSRPMYETLHTGMPVCVHGSPTIGWCGGRPCRTSSLRTCSTA
jgi:predicted AlkP superfamily pyrophosphatase or phosphodiesterase